MNSKEMVMFAQQQAKWNADIKRRQKAQLYIDYWENNTTQIIDKTLKGEICVNTELGFNRDSDSGELLPFEIKKLNSPEYHEMRKFIEHVNTTERLIDEISLVYSAGLKVSVADKDEEAKEQSELQKFVDDTDLLMVLMEVNKRVNLLKDVAVIPQVRRGKVVFDIITPEKSFVEQDELDPTYAKRFYYQVGVLENSTKANKITVWHYWEDGVKWQCEIDPDTGYIDNRQIVENSLRYEENPVVMFRNYIPEGRFWSNKTNSIVQTNVVIDLRKTDMQMGEYYQVPSRVNVGIPKEQSIKGGRISMLNIPPDMAGGASGNSFYITPDNKLEVIKELISDRVNQLGIGLGLSMSTITGESATSGFHLQVSKHEIIQRNVNQRPYYAKPTKRLIKLGLETAEKAKIKYGVSSKVDIALDFGETTFPQSAEEKARTRALRMANGTGSRIDFIMEDNPDLDRKQAEEKALQIDNDNAKFRKKREISFAEKLNNEEVDEGVIE